VSQHSNGNGSPGLGELARRVQEVLVQFEKLGVRLESQFVRRDVLDLLIQNLRDEQAEQQKDIEALEDDKKWLIRTVIGTVLVSLVSGIALWAKIGGG
jgi:chaperonin cofactor prefoldin